MRRAERLFRIVNEMRTREVIRACDLATIFDISLSTVYRDIAHLQASGLPIDGEAGVGYLLRPGFDLPNVAFTNDQIDALAVGLAFAERTGDPVLATAAREVRAKLQAIMPDPRQRKLADAPFFSLHAKGVAGPHAATLRGAIRAQRVVLLRYATPGGAVTDRRLRPLVIWDLGVGWMVSGWCEWRQGFRTFRWDRIESLVCTDETFRDEAGTGLLAFMQHETCHRREA